MFKNKTLLITGGTGSFGNAVLNRFLDTEIGEIRIFSRDEKKQDDMRHTYQAKYPEASNKIKFYIGDVRDLQSVRDAMHGVDYIFHAAALKQVPSCEYNPMEAVKTNINGAMNIVDAALDCSVKRVVALSTDKAVNPINLYGGTKLVSDKLFIAANAYAGEKDVNFSVVRYGNVAGSRGSVIPFFRNIVANGGTSLPITDYRMTRFWISLEQGVELVIKALSEARGGETFISKIPSFKITDLAQAILPGCDMPEIGIREGEKLHEIMITREDSMLTYEYDKHFIIYPHFNWWGTDKIISGGKMVDSGFEYSSGTNKEWLTIEELKKLLSDMGKH